MSSFSTYKLKGISATLDQVTIPSGHTFKINGVLSLNANSGAFQLPAGTTAQRPGSPQTGYFRYNTDNQIVEIYDGSAWVNYDFASSESPASGGGGGTGIPDEYLVYVMDATGDVRSPTFKTLGTVLESDTSVTSVAFSEISANSNWTVMRVTSNLKPWNQYRFARGTNSDLALESLANNYGNWAMSNNSTQSVTPLQGSSTKVGQTLQFQHNNGGSETHDIVTLGNTGGSVWSTGMIWGNIDSTGNYKGIVNNPYAESGSSGGNTGDRLYVYLETGPTTYNAADYTNYLTPTGPLGDATTFDWNWQTTSGNGSSTANNVADAISRDTTSDWPSYGIQQQSNTAWIDVDLGLGNEQTFDFTFAIGYPNGSHASNQNEIEASNDRSNWTTVSQWKYHNGSNDSLGMLYYNSGSHLYSNTITDPNKWHPIITNGIKYRYWRLSGSNFNTTNGYQLVMNWALLQKNS